MRQLSDPEHREKSTHRAEWKSTEIKETKKTKKNQGGRNMRTQKKILSILSILSLLLTMLPLQVLAAGSTISQQRLGGVDRYQTAAAVTGAGWQASESVIIGGGGG
jgi:hypothetical protein